MRVQVLTIEGCAGGTRALGRVREALQRTANGAATLEHHVVRDAGEAQALGFAGSPTILVDGIDLFASVGALADLACRVYRTPEGLANAPTVEQIVDALQQR